jgi:hypothetical protein
MAFTVTIIDQYYAGDKKVVVGKWATDTTTGELDLSAYFDGKINFIALTMKDSSAVADAPTVNETFPLDSATAITLLFTSAKAGYFRAEGVGA